MPRRRGSSTSVDLLAERERRRKAAHDRRAWDGSGHGASDATSPLYGTRAGDAEPPPSPIVLPSGETVTLIATGVSGGLLEFSDFAAGRQVAGFPALSLPATQVPVSLGGYYGATINRLEVADRSGAVLAVLRDGDIEVETFGGSRGKHLAPRTVETGLLSPGAPLSVACDASIVEASVSFYLIDLPWQIAIDLPSVTVPPDLGVVIGWWMADQIEGVADETVVTTWEDQSGHSRHLSGSPTLGPILQEDTLGGLPTCYFGTAATRRTCVAAWPNIIKPLTYYVLARWDTLGGFTIHSANAQASSYCDRLQAVGVGGSTVRTYNTSGPNIDGAGQAQTGWHIWSYQSTSGGRTIWRDGTQVASGAATTSEINGIRFGDIPTPSGLPMDGAIAEVAVFREAHDATQRATMHTYLEGKWGL